MDKNLETERFQSRQEEEGPEESPGRDTNWARGSPRSPAGQRLDPRQTARRTSSSKVPAFPRAQEALGQGNRGSQAPVPRQASMDLRSNLATDDKEEKGTQMLENSPAIQETQVQSLGQEDLQEKGMATHSNILT